jgi:hypothetical protein
MSVRALAIASRRSIEFEALRNETSLNASRTIAATQATGKA